MSIVDLSSLDLNNIPTLRPCDADTEHKLRINECATGTGQSGLDWYRFRCEVTDDEQAPEVTVFVTMPDASIQEPKKFSFTAQMFRDFLSAFGVDLDASLDLESDLIGKEAWAILGQKEGQMGLENTVKRWLAQK